MNYQRIENNYLVQTYIRRGLTITKGKGVFLFDRRGKKYLDFTSNFGVNILGHSAELIKSTIAKQMKKLQSLHNSFANDKRALASRKLIERTAGKLQRVFWSNSGTEAVEAAIKFSFLYNKRKKFISLKNSYLGKTLGSLSLMGNQKYRRQFKELLNRSVEFVEVNDINGLRQAIDQKTCAVFMEPILGEGGIVSLEEEFLKTARSLTRKFNSLLVFDEIQTGVGRTGKFLACQHFNIYPDIICLAKGLAAGMPVGATLLSEKVHRNIPRKIHTNTFGGNPLVCACSASVLKKINENLLLKVEELGNYFLDELRSINSKKIVNVRGIGLMVAVELNCPMTPTVKKMQKNGLLAIPTKNTIIRFLPPLIVEKKQIDSAVKIFKESI